MARLPSSESLGQRPTPQAGRAISGYDGGAMGRALEGVGQQVGQVGDQLRHADEQLRAVEQAKQRADAGLALAKLNNQLHDTHDELARGLSDGTVDPKDVDGLFTKRSNEIRSQGLQGLNDRQRQMIADNLEANTGALQRSLTNNVVKRYQSDVAGAIDQFGEEAQRSAMRVGPQMAADKYSAFIDFNGATAGLPPDKRDKLKQAFSEKVHYAYFDTLGTDALTKDDAAGLKALRERVNGKEGEAIDPLKRAQLTHQLFGYEQHIEAKRLAAMNAADREQLAREKTAVEYHNKTIDLLVNGNQLSPEFIKEATTAAAGTEVAASLGTLLAGQGPLAGFATKPAAERGAILERFRNQAADPAKGTDPMQAAMVKQLTSVDEGLKSKIKENPWSAAQGAGVIKDAPAFDVADLGLVGPVLQNRMQNIAQVEAWAGRKVSPLQPEEVQQITSKLKALPPEQAADFLGGVGQQLANPERIAQVADQLDSGSKPLSLSLKLGTDRTNAGRAVSALVLKGSQALADKTVKRDDATLTGWRADISSQVRGTLGDQQMENDIIDAAYYVRAAMDEPGYQFKAGTAQALKLVIGEPMERGGVKTILPRGMDENAFTEKLRAFTPEQLKMSAPTGEVYIRGQKRTVEQLSSSLHGMGMRRNGAGKYAPVSGGSFVTLDKEGQVPLLLDVR